MNKQPARRHGRSHGIKVLSDFFDYPIDPFSQDWTYEVAEPEKIADYIEAYETASFDEDTKFSLMEMIIEAANDCDSVENWWPKIKTLLKKDFTLHEYTIYYWCCFDSKLEDSFAISKRMRDLWKSLSPNT